MEKAIDSNKLDIIKVMVATLVIILCDFCAYIAYAQDCVYFNENKAETGANACFVMDAATPSSLLVVAQYDNQKLVDIAVQSINALNAGNNYVKWRLS